MTDIHQDANDLSQTAPPEVSGSAGLKRNGYLLAANLLILVVMAIFMLTVFLPGIRDSANVDAERIDVVNTALTIGWNLSIGIGFGAFTTAFGLFAWAFVSKSRLATDMQNAKALSELSMAVRIGIGVTIAGIVILSLVIASLIFLISLS